MDRKYEHMKKALASQTSGLMRDRRFIYEPALSGHPTDAMPSFTFLGREMKAPIWISSMTGGTRVSQAVNRNIARACRELGLGMGLGSCRSILSDNACWDDFDMRDEIGPDRPLWANLGIAQVEKLLKAKNEKAIDDMVGRLQADGLIIHINPLQEWFQPEGDIIEKPPVDTIDQCLEKLKTPLIVKEVGQGMGQRSLEKLLDMPLAAIELGAFGGTNFTLLEMQRNKEVPADLYNPFLMVGHTAAQMIKMINAITGNHEPRCGQLIISGGIKNFMDGFYHVSLSKLPSVFGMASAVLEYAVTGYEPLRSFLDHQIEAYKLAQAFLRINPDYDE